MTNKNYIITEQLHKVTRNYSFFVSWNILEKTHSYGTFQIKEKMWMLLKKFLFPHSLKKEMT